jgi:hypothetical protein
MKRNPETPVSDMAAMVEPLEIIQLGKDEMNLAEWPITLLTDRVPKGKNVIQYQDTIFDEKSNKQITRKLTISAGESIGLPTPVDDDVILGLIQLTKLTNSFASREVEFSRLDFIKLLGWPDSGDSYRRLTTSLKRWLSVTLLYENAWRDNNQGAWTTKGFHILDNIELNDGRTTAIQGELFPSKIIWNKVVFDSFKAGYLKSIDYGLYVNLRHTIARRMYRFLSKRMYFGPNLKFDLFDLAFAHIGLSGTYKSNAGKVKEKLQPAIEELEAIGFLETMEKDARYWKDGKNWQIRLICRTPTPTASLAANDSGPVLPPLAAELVKRGMTQAVALELVAKQVGESIQLKLDVFDWMVEQKDKRLAKNPAGFLRKSITDDYSVPPGFIPREERQRLQDAIQAKDQQTAESRRLQRDKDAREKAERQKLDAYWDSLTPDQQIDHQAQANALADPKDLAQETGPLKRMGEHLRRLAYTRQILQEKGMLPTGNQP